LKPRSTASVPPSTWNTQPRRGKLLAKRVVEAGRADRANRRRAVREPDGADAVPRLAGVLAQPVAEFE